VKTWPAAGRTPVSEFFNDVTAAGYPLSAVGRGRILHRHRQLRDREQGVRRPGVRWSAGTDRAGSWAIYESTIPRARRHANAVAAESGCGFLGASGPRLRAKSALRSSDQRGPGRRLSPKRPLGRKDHRARGRAARVGAGGDASGRRHRTIRARSGASPSRSASVQATRRRGRRRALLERA